MLITTSGIFPLSFPRDSYFFLISRIRGILCDSFTTLCLPSSPCVNHVLVYNYLLWFYLAIVRRGKKSNNHVFVFRSRILVENRFEGKDEYFAFAHLSSPPIFITRQSIYFAWVDADTKEIARHNRSLEMLGQIQKCLKQPRTLLPFENVKYYVIRDVRFESCPFPLPWNFSSVTEFRSLVFLFFHIIAQRFRIIGAIIIFFFALFNF